MAGPRAGSQTAAAWNAGRRSSTLPGPFAGRRTDRGDALDRGPRPEAAGVSDQDGVQIDAVLLVSYQSKWLPLPDLSEMSSGFGFGL